MVLLVSLLAVVNAMAQNFRVYTAAVCPNQTVTYVLESIPAGYRINASGASGGTLLNTPSVDTNNNTASYEVKWGLGATGSVAPGLEKPIKDAQGRVTSWDPVPLSTAPSVIIKSVFGVRINAQINGTGSLDLPLCGGAQQLTLFLPQFYFDNAQLYPVDAYVWSIPATFTVVNGTPATEFGAGRWLSGRSITVSVPAGQFSETVSAVLWSRECNQNAAYGNPPASLISNPQSLSIRRTLPTLTSVTASRTALTCGDQRPLTLTATTSQAGASSFTWALPTGWTFAPGSGTTTASVSVVPNGANGGQVTTTAFYSCANYTTPANSVTIGYNPQVATPAAFTSPVAQNGNVDVCANAQPLFRVAAVPGATSYEWTYPVDFVVVGNPGAPNPYITTVPEVRLQAPGSFSSTSAAVRVRALNASCQPSNYLDARLRTGSGGILITSSDYTASGGTVCPYTSLTLLARSEQQTGTNSGYQWSVNGMPVAGNATASLELQMPESGPVSVQVQLTNSCDGVKTASWYVNVQQRAVCSPQTRLAQPAAYPNPANATLTLQQPAGTVLTIYSAQGRLMYSGKAGKRPVQLDTRNWPEGLYYLLTRNAGTTTRQQLQIKH